MSKLSEEYNKTIEQRKKILEELNPLEENETVQKYLKLKEQNEALYNQELNLYRDLKMEEYDSCNHILVYSQIDHDVHEGRAYECYGCIKCGLDNSVLYNDRKSPLGIRKVMYDYLRKNNFLNKGIATEVVCDLDLAKAIYAKIKEKHPDIDDETAKQYFENALDHIRDIEVSENRQANRARRLSLKSDFKNWNGSDVHYY